MHDNPQDLNQNFITLLDHFTVLKVTGPDACTFLQGQLTCNVANLKPGKAKRGLYCNAQGRILASFILFRLDDDYYLRLPHDNLANLKTQLEKYARFSKLDRYLP